MILKKENQIFSVEKIVKKNVFSESKNGNIFVHMFVHKKNCVPLPFAVSSLQPDVLEQNLYVSPRGSYGFRGNVNLTYLKFPINGKFQYVKYSGGVLLPMYDYSYECIATAIAKSRRYIHPDQLQEIREKGNFDLEYEGDFYQFVKFPVIPIEYEFRFFSYENLMRILIELRPFFSTETPYDYFKNTLNDVKFFLKIKPDQLKKTDQQCIYYYQLDVAESTKKILKRILHTDTDNKYYISKPDEYGYISCEEEEIYLRTNKEIANTDTILVRIPREIILESLSSMGLYSFEDEYIPV